MNTEPDTMTNDLNTLALLCFAKRTLAILEAHKDWDADAADSIARAACDLGLAETDAAGHFRSEQP